MTTNDLPERVFLTRKDVVDSALGISRHAFDQAVRAGALERFVLPGCVRGKYKRDDVLRVFGVSDATKSQTGAQT